GAASRAAVSTVRPTASGLTRPRTRSIRWTFTRPCTTAWAWTRSRRFTTTCGARTPSAPGRSSRRWSRKGVIQNMCISRHPNVVAILLVLLASTCWLDSGSWAGDKKADDPKAPIALPKDPKTVVLSYDPGAGGFIRKGPPPYLKIQADGQVTVTN